MLEVSMWFFITCLGLGAGVGFLSGLLGIGGGLLIVPALSFLLPQAGIEPSLVMSMSLATSLASIIITSAASTYSHYRLGNIDTSVIRLLLPGMIAGGLLGSSVAEILPAYLLPKIFACIVFLLALQMGLAKPIETEKSFLPSKFSMFSGLCIGMVSSLAGIGGGAFTVPFLHYFGVPMRKAIGSASICGVFLAFSGMLGFVFWGLQQSQSLPTLSLGYVYLPALLGVVMTSVLTTRIGARLASRLSTPYIRRIFSIFLLLVGASMFF